MPKLEHDIIRPWLCCKECKREYDTRMRRANGRPVSIDRLKDGTRAAERHDDIIDLLLEKLHGI